MEQHSDFSVAPLMLTSQRLSWIVSQQVLFMLSAEPRQPRHNTFRSRTLTLTRTAPNQLPRANPNVRLFVFHPS